MHLLMRMDIQAYRSEYKKGGSLMNSLFSMLTDGLLRTAYSRNPAQNELI